MSTIAFRASLIREIKNTLSQADVMIAAAGDYPDEDERLATERYYAGMVDAYEHVLWIIGGDEF